MKEISSRADEIVLLPVPLQHVQEVARFSASLALGEASPTSATADGPLTESVPVEGQGLWTQAMVDRLSDSVTYGAVLALLDECASRGGQWVSKAEVEQAGGFSAIQLRNELGALSKKTIKLFGEATWPMEWKKERGAYSYRMSTTIAEWWAAAREEANK